MIPDPAELRLRGIDQVIAQASRLSRGDVDPWETIFKPAKAALLEMELTDEERLSAVAALTEAMKV